MQTLPECDDDRDNVWLWTLGGPTLIGLAVLSGFVLAHDVRTWIAVDDEPTSTQYATIPVAEHMPAYTPAR